MIKKNMLKEYLRYILPDDAHVHARQRVRHRGRTCSSGNAVGDAGRGGHQRGVPARGRSSCAVGTGIGMGGAVISSIRARTRRRGVVASRRGQRRSPLLVVAALPAHGRPAACCGSAICRAFWAGAAARSRQAVGVHRAVIAWGAPFLVFVRRAALPLIRNRGRVGFAMGVAVLAGLVNVALDWRVRACCSAAGTAGAAAATAVSQAGGVRPVRGVLPDAKASASPVRDFGAGAHTVGHALKLGHGARSA